MLGSSIGKWPTVPTSWNSSLCQSEACLAPAGHEAEALRNVRTHSGVMQYVIYNESLKTCQPGNSSHYSYHEISLLKKNQNIQLKVVIKVISVIIMHVFVALPPFCTSVQKK